MFYRNSGITGKTLVELSTTIKTMSDISIVMTLSTLPTKRCGLYSITQQRTLGMDSNGHLCYWFYDGKNDRCLNGSTVLSGTNVKVGAIHSRNGVRLYVNGILDAFCEAPLWSEGCNLSYIGTHGLAPSDLEMDGEIGGVLLTDYAMTDDEMSVASWNSELCVNDNRLFYVPSRTTLHVDDSIVSSLSDGHVYVLEDTGSLVLSNEEKLPCWYLGEYNSTTQDVTLNISEKKGGGTYNRMEIDHLMVHDIDVADTGHAVEADGADVYPYLAINENNNAIFTNPHISTMKVEYHCTANVVPNPNTITVWGSSYDDTFPYIYAKYTITYKDGASGTIITVVRDPSHQQYMVRTVTCYVESTSSTYTWPTDPTTFASGTTLSFYGRNAHAGKYQFTRQWTWFGIDWFASSHSDRPNASVVTGFTSGHWVSGSETALFVVDDDYLRNIVVVEDVVSQSVKDYATSHGKPVSSYMGKKSLPSSLTSGYALKDSTGSLQAKDCYLDEIHADGFRTETVDTSNSSEWGFWRVDVDSPSSLHYLKYEISPSLLYECPFEAEGEFYLNNNTTDPNYRVYSARQYWNSVTYPPRIRFNGMDTFSFDNWWSEGYWDNSFINFMTRIQSLDVPSDFNTIDSVTGKPVAIAKLCMRGRGNPTSQVWTFLTAMWEEGTQFKIETINGVKCPVFTNATIINPSGQSYSGMELVFERNSDLTAVDKFTVHTRNHGYPSSLVPTDIPINLILLSPTLATVNGTTHFCSIRRKHGYITNEDGSTSIDYADIYVQGESFVDIKLDLSGSAITCRQDIRQRILTSLGTTPTFEEVNGAVYSGIRNFAMKIQSWNYRGLIKARSIDPFKASEDAYIKKYGASLGSVNNPWATVFTKSISYGREPLIKPLYVGNTMYAMFFYDHWVMMWGNFSNKSNFTVWFPKTLAYSSYTVITNSGVSDKDTSYITFTGGSSSYYYLMLGYYN